MFNRTTDVLDPEHAVPFRMARPPEPPLITLQAFVVGVGVGVVGGDGVLLSPPQLDATRPAATRDAAAPHRHARCAKAGPFMVTLQW
jgi:hypothetical protein